MYLFLEVSCKSKCSCTILTCIYFLIIFNHFLTIFNFLIFYSFAFRTFALIIASIDHFDLVLKPVVIFGHPRDPGSPFNPPLKKTEFNFDFLNFNHVNDPKSTPTEKEGESINKESNHDNFANRFGLEPGRGVVDEDLVEKDIENEAKENAMNLNVQ